jgi:peptide methionine sulfoxide reductase msrA/msrB
MRRSSIVIAVLGLAATLVGWVGLRGKPANPPRPKGVVYSASGHDISPLSQDEVKKRAAKLTAEQRDILLHAGTEPPFCGGHLDNKDAGTYTCALCGLPLFDAGTKFDSKTGWPSFHTPYDPQHIREVKDSSHGMVRTEIRCARCDGHLGHVFDDGPPPTGQRYCLNSASLSFTKAGAELPPESKPATFELAYFAGGCFWGIEDAFERIPGVVEATSGYMGGHVDNPSYEAVCTAATGHAETVEVRFDPKRVSYKALLEFFFNIHDPTTLNRQGPDVGPQYRSAIFATTDAQAAEARAHIAELAKAPRMKGKRVVTTVSGKAQFWRAEDYHQDYNARTGHQCHVDVEPFIPK